jgi:acyl-CoA thioesterase YciA
MSYLDMAGAVEARKLCGAHNIVTVAMDKIVFHKPVFVGDLVSFYTETKKIGRTSVTIRIIVEATRADTQERVNVTEGEVVYVLVDENWKPVPVKQGNKTAILKNW